MPEKKNRKKKSELKPGVFHWQQEILLLAREVARREKVDVKTVERWIGEKGLPYSEATPEQKVELFAQGLITSLPPHGIIYLIREEDLHYIPEIRAYPKNRKKPEPKGTKTGAGEAQS